MPGYHHVEDVMGMAVSIDVRDDVVGTPGLASVLEWLHHVDRTFSTYREDSVLTGLGRGERSLDEVTSEVRHVLRRCEALRTETDGAFDAFAVLAPNGTRLDPSGYVKGWAVEEAARILEEHGVRDLCINAGGDVAVRGGPTPGGCWRVGIRDPDDPAGLADLLAVPGPAGIATSGTYERGAHIIDPSNGEPTTAVASVTVVGPDLGTADAFATAVFVMGAAGIDWLTDQPGYDGMILTHDRRRLGTPGFERWRLGTAAGR